MKRKKKLLVALVVVFGVVFISGASILAASTLGTSGDPLVTLSYLTSKFKPQVMSDVDAKISAAENSASADLDAKVSGFKSDIAAKAAASTADPVGFTLVTLSKGQTVSCAVGTELLLRIGTAAANGSSPALVDSTDGDSLASGGALAANHMYLVTIQGNGFTATASTVKVLIRGEYSVG